MQGSKPDDHSGAFSTSGVGNGPSPGSVTHFASWLTTRPKVIKVGGSETVYDMFEAAKEYADTFGAGVVAHEYTSPEVASSAGRLLATIDDMSVPDTMEIPLWQKFVADIKSVAGSALTQTRGLNDDEPTMVDMHEANAVEFLVDDNGKAWLNIDGRCRARVGKTAIIVTEIHGNKVVRRDARNAEAKYAMPIDEKTTEIKQALSKLRDYVDTDIPTDDPMNRNARFALHTLNELLKSSVSIFVPPDPTLPGWDKSAEPWKPSEGASDDLPNMVDQND